MSVPRINVNADSRVQAEVLRLVVTRNANGDVILENYCSVYGTHWADIQPLSNSDRIANEQLKIRATHRIFPEPYLFGIVQINDFFRDGTSNLYRVTGVQNFRTLAYYDAWHEAFGIDHPATNESSTFYSFSNVAPGSYTFGSGILLGVPTFSQAPFVFVQETSDSEMYVDSLTVAGFTIAVSEAGADPPLCNLYIKEI